MTTPRHQYSHSIYMTSCAYRVSLQPASGITTATQSIEQAKEACTNVKLVIRGVVKSCCWSVILTAMWQVYISAMWFNIDRVDPKFWIGYICESIRSFFANSVIRKFSRPTVKILRRMFQMLGVNEKKESIINVLSVGFSDCPDWGRFSQTLSATVASYDNSFVNVQHPSEYDERLRSWQ